MRNVSLQGINSTSGKDISHSNIVTLYRNCLYADKNFTIETRGGRKNAQNQHILKILKEMNERSYSAII